MDKRRKGIYKKFFVERTDGSSGNGGKHEHCQYFVLDVTHDPFAIPALKAYADACAEEYPVLSVELKELSARQEIKVAEQTPTNTPIMPVCPIVGINCQFRHTTVVTCSIGGWCELCPGKPA
jgi:hypothetical protein